MIKYQWNLLPLIIISDYNIHKTTKPSVSKIYLGFKTFAQSYDCDVML